MEDSPAKINPGQHPHPPSGNVAASSGDDARLVEELRAAGLLREGDFQVIPLSGGVSSEIRLFRQGAAAFVVKRALERLRVADEWICDPARSRSELDYLREVGAILPGVVPRVLHANPTAHFFVMEYLGEGWLNWKAELMAGRIAGEWSRIAGEALGRIHRETGSIPRLRETFDTGGLFFALRIEPYLLTAGRRNPALQDYFFAEAARLQKTSLALVHGDFSPKNILIHPGEGRMVLLDCEVAWYGDPAFDVAFLLSHLFLKALWRPETARAALGAAASFLEAYDSARGTSWDADDARRAARLLLLLLVARIDGKSPVEYLVGATEKQKRLRAFAATHLARSGQTPGELASCWLDAITLP